MPPFPVAKETKSVSSIWCNVRCWLLASFLALALWQFFVLPQHFSFLHVLSDKPVGQRPRHKKETLDHTDYSIQQPFRPKVAEVSQGSSVKSLESKKQYYDIMALIFATGSTTDVERMKMAEKTWLSWHGNYTANYTMSWVFALCKGDPGTKVCKSDGKCPGINAHAVMLPCKQDYKRLIGKGIAGYRYIADNFQFKYVLKADVDSIIDVKCTTRRITEIPKRCRFWGMGLWRAVRDSKVFGASDPGAGKYVNEAYRRDTGNDWYPPYMTGWAMVWSGDVARFLGMAGMPSEGLDAMPSWRDTWTIEDAAIGTFIAGLNLCRVSLRDKCMIQTDLKPGDYKIKDLILTQASEEALVDAITVDREGSMDDFEGPLNDDIPELGDLANVQAKSMKHCAAKCYVHSQCRSFEFSVTAKAEDDVKNCQLVSRKFPRVGKRFKDFNLYIRRDI